MPEAHITLVSEVDRITFKDKRLSCGTVVTLIVTVPVRSLIRITVLQFLILRSTHVIMAQLDLPLPEITVADFQRSWTRFELVASAKEWDAAKQKLILPTLLRGKLVDSYVALNESAHETLVSIKKALMESVGIAHDPLTAGQAFMCCHQGSERLCHGSQEVVPGVLPGGVTSVAHPFTKIFNWPFTTSMPPTSAQWQARSTGPSHN